jgi:hypothetical protein
VPFGIHFDRRIPAPNQRICQFRARHITFARELPKNNGLTCKHVENHNCSQVNQIVDETYANIQFLLLFEK